MDLKKYFNEYKDLGVVVIPKVFNLKEINSLRSAALTSLTKLSEINRNGYKHKAIEYFKINNNISPSIIFWPSLASVRMNAFRTHKKLVSVVSFFLGNNVKQLNNQFYFRLPGDGDSFAWHQDVMFRKPIERHPHMVKDDGYLQTSIVVDEITNENSPIEYILGSNRLGNLKLDENKNWKGLRGYSSNEIPYNARNLICKKIYALPGDLIIWSSLTIHGSSQNLSNSSRMYYMNGFANAKNAFDWPWYIKSGSICELNPSEIP